MTEAIRRRHWASVIGAASLLYLTGLGVTDVWSPDEPRYAQVAEELRSMEHGWKGLVLLHLDGEAYSQKPPLYYWLAAAFGAPGGRVTEAAGRLPSALAGVGVIALTLALGARLLGARVGLLGAVLLLTAFEFSEHARRIQLDVLLTLFETFALFCFWRIDRARAAARVWIGLMHGALGLAVLTKGPVGFLLPLLTVVAYRAWEGRLAGLRELFPPWAWLLSLGPGLLWALAAVALAPPGYAEDAFGQNLFGRFFAGTSHARPFYYFAYKLPLDFLPWTLLWPLVVWGARNRLPSGEGDAGGRRAWRFLLAWIGASLLFFSISAGKRGLYLLPVFPALALLCADGLLRYLAFRGSLPRLLTALLGLGAAVAFALALGLAFLAAGGSLEAAGFAPSDPRVALLQSHLSDQHRPLLVAFGVAVLSVLAAAALAWLGLRRSPALSRFQVVVGAVFALELATFLVLYPARDPSKSPRPIAESAASFARPGHPIGLLGNRAMTGGLAYYGGRPIAALRAPESVERFVRSCAGPIVVKTRKVERVERFAPVEIVSRNRVGRREVLVVVPRVKECASALHPGRGSPDAGVRTPADSTPARW